jgi:hypothetical protein
VVPAAEPAYVTGLGEDLRGVDGSDSGDLQQGGRVCSHPRTGGADLKTVSEMLGHSTITITADTYATVLSEVARRAAEAAARLVPPGN